MAKMQAEWRLEKRQGIEARARKQMEGKASMMGRAFWRSLGDPRRSPEKIAPMFFGVSPEWAEIRAIEAFADDRFGPRELFELGKGLGYAARKAALRSRGYLPSWGLGLAKADLPGGERLSALISGMALERGFALEDWFVGEWLLRFLKAGDGRFETALAAGASPSALGKARAEDLMSLVSHPLDTCHQLGRADGALALLRYGLDLPGSVPSHHSSSWIAPPRGGMGMGMALQSLLMANGAFIKGSGGMSAGLGQMQSLFRRFRGFGLACAARGRFPPLGDVPIGKPQAESLRWEDAKGPIGYLVRAEKVSDEELAKRMHDWARNAIGDGQAETAWAEGIWMDRSCARDPAAPKAKAKGL